MVAGCGGATPERAKWIFDSTSTLSPLKILIWWTFPTKKRTECSATSITARSVAGAERERKVGR